MIIRQILITGLFVAGILSATRSFALPGYLSQWQSEYSTSNSGSAGCQLCHQGSGGGNGWNPYGWVIREMYLSNGNDISNAITSVEGVDSDNDPSQFSNITEINADTQPGWTDGDVNTIYFNDNTTSLNQPPPNLGSPLDPPNIMVAPLSLDFGVLELGGSPSGPQPVLIENTGQAMLNLGDINLCAGTSTEFSFPASGNVTLAPGESETVNVTYTPTDDDVDLGCMEINSDDPDSQAINVDLFGHGCTVVNANVDVDIEQLVVTEDTRVGGPAINIALNLVSTCSVSGQVQASLTGFRNSAMVHSQQVPINFLALAGTQVISFLDYVPVETGIIDWTVTVADADADTDEAFADTNVDPAALDDPLPAPIARGNLTVRLETVASGLVAPNYAIGTPALPGYLFVVDQPGQVWKINLESGAREAFLDVSAQLVSLGIFGNNTFDERGLLGLAFHPDYASNGLLYTYTSEPLTGAADFSTMPTGVDAEHQSVIAEWMVANPTNPADNVTMGSRRVLLRVDQPQFNHDGGGIAFGPDDLLHIVFGDGGGADDVDGQPFIGGNMVGHGATGNGQDAMNPLGAILRIDPAGSNSGNGQYGIPVDNPFIGGDPKLDEIYAYGLRNAFRFSFDSQSGDLYAADVGQNDIEEINMITKGGNYGWNVKEGSKYFYPSGVNSGFVSDIPPDSLAPGLIDPILEYDHDEGISVIGGFVYRGEKYGPMQGKYVFGDWSSDFSNPSGRLFYNSEGSTISEFRFDGRNQLGLFLQGFGQDQSGELYLLGNTTGTPFGTTGVVMRIDLVPEELCFPIRASYGYWAQICL